MLEFHRDRFAQLLHEVPAKETILPEPKYSPYLQTVMDTVKKDGVLNLAMKYLEAALDDASIAD